MAGGPYGPLCNAWDMGKSMHPDLVKERRMGDLLKGSFGFMGFVFQGDMYSMYSLFQPHMKDFIYFESLMTMKHYDDLVHMGFLNHHRPLTIPPRKAGHLSPKKVTSRSAKSNFFFQEKMTHKTTPKPSHHGEPVGFRWFPYRFLSGKKREEEFQRKMQSIMEKPRELGTSVFESTSQLFRPQQLV